MSTPSVYTYTNFFFPQQDVSQTKADGREKHTKRSKRISQRPMDNFDMDIDEFVSSVGGEQKQENDSDESTNQYKFNPAQVMCTLVVFVGP